MISCPSWISEGWDGQGKEHCKSEELAQESGQFASMCTSMKVLIYCFVLLNDETVVEATSASAWIFNKFDYTDISGHFPEGSLKQQ